MPTNHKYIDVDEYINRHAAYPADHRITLMCLVQSLKDQDAADVIPTAYIREWFREHYGTDACPLVDDYKGG